MEHIMELEWCIENFSCWNQEVHEECITIPSLVACLALYPRGRNGRDEKCMEVDMASINGHTPPGELSFLCSDGSLIHKQQVENPDEDDKSITVLGPRLEEVLLNIQEKEEDSLTLRYWFKSKEENKQKLRTVIEVIDTSFKIDPVALVSDKMVSLFTFLTKMEIKLFSLTFDKKGNVTRLQIELSPTKDVILVKTCVSFLKNGNVIEKYEEKEHVFRGEEEWLFFSINEKELVERGGTVLLRLKIITGNAHFYPNPTILAEGVSIIPKNIAGFFEQEPPESLVVTSDHTDDSVTVLTKELMCLFQDQEFSDLELKCRGVSFPVHKVILSARSPVFKRLLCSDMREAASGSVDIEDLDAPTLARFLTFLYTGAVGEDLNADSALNLYYAADKYQVPTLKKECVKFLCDNTSVTNICDILSLAHKHGDDELTEVSRKYILENLNEVLASENWKSFIKKEPLLAVETVTHFAGNVHVKKQSSK